VAFDDLGAIGDIADTIFGDAIDSVAELFGSGKLSKLTKQDESGLKQFNTTKPKISDWYGPRGSFDSQYALLLKYNGTTIQLPFLINPQSEQVTEPHAVSTTYTQGGGKITQSEGCVSKEIVISGTFGLYPNQRGSKKPESGKKSGFEAFVLLKQIFRRYCFLRRFGDLSKPIQLVYISRRRQEAWVVEPKSLTSDDAVDHNFTTRYSLVMEALEPYDGKEFGGLIDRLFSNIPFFNDIVNIVQAATELSDSLNASINQLSAFVSDFSTKLMQPFVSLINSLSDLVANRQTNLQNFKRDSMRNLGLQFRQAGFSLEAAGQTELANKCFNAEKTIHRAMNQQTLFEQRASQKGQETSDKIKREVSKYRDGSGNVFDATAATGAGGLSKKPDSSKVSGKDISNSVSLGAGPKGKVAAPAGTLTAAVANDLNKRKTVTRTSVGGAAQDQNPNFTINQAGSTAIDGNSMVPPDTSTLISGTAFTSQFQISLQNIDPSRADYRTDKVHIGDDIKTLAYRLLGDHMRWPELVLLNGLRYPYVASQAYIDANSLTNVLAYGDDILYPIQKQSSLVSPIRVFRNETNTSLSLSGFERSLGNDILVDEKTGDIVFTANDIALTYGTENVGQFARKIFTVRRGSYRRSVNLGFSEYVGLSSTVLESVVGIEAQALFAGDERITGVQVLGLQQSAGSLIIKAAIAVKDQQDPIITTFSL